jgi:hypothetical protein
MRSKPDLDALGHLFACEQEGIVPINNKKVSF